MSHEAIEMIREMDLGQIENQLAFQCAPLLAGLKMANICIIHKKVLKRLCCLLNPCEIRCRVLYRDGDKLSVLLYHPAMLSAYLRGKRAQKLLEQEGYEGSGLESVLLLFACRYRQYRRDLRCFPHELGLLLGYPLDDVEGFIRNDGKNSLYTGYWKVYANVPAKRQLFRRYEQAREELMEQICHGVKLEQVLSRWNRRRRHKGKEE